MPTIILKLRSSIRTQLQRKMLFKGTFYGGLGVFLLLISSIYASSSVLQIWGGITYSIALGLICYGLIPYRKLIRLEKHPHLLLVTEDKKLLFCHQGKRLWEISFSNIDKMYYVESSLKYGITLKLFDAAQKALFLPYFSKMAFKQLENELQ